MQETRAIIIKFNPGETCVLLSDNHGWTNDYNFPKLGKTDHDKPRCIVPLFFMRDLISKIMNNQDDDMYEHLSVKFLRNHIKNMYKQQKLVVEYPIRLQTWGCLYLLYEIGLPYDIVHKQEGFKWVKLDEAFSRLDRDDQYILAWGLIEARGLDPDVSKSLASFILRWL